MKLYKNAEGQWVLNGGIIPQGSCYMTVTPTGKVVIYLLNQKSLFSGDVTDLQDEDGEPYADMTTFLAACGSFFVNPLDSLEKEVEGLKSVYKTATLTVAGWVRQEQTVTVEGVTATNNPFISWPENRGEYLEWQATNISVTGQGVDELTFTATTTPTIDITVNVEVK